MIWIISLFIAASAAADIAAWRFGRLSCGGSQRAARVLLGILLTADCVPLMVKCADYLVADNTQAFCDASMWIMTVWAMTVVPKTAVVASLLVSRRRAVHAAGAAVAAAMVAMLVYGIVWGRKDLRVTRVEIHSQRLPESFDGFRIALFSDLHIGALTDAETEIERVVETINSLDADAVFFCGDLVNIRHTELDSARMALLGRIRSAYGTFCVTGNHDTGFYVADSVSLPLTESRRMILEKERLMDWHPLECRSTALRRGGDSISVTGIGFFDELNEKRHARRISQFDLSAAYEGVDTAAFNITLAHIPQMWPQIRSAGGGDLTLSGHVHAMQLKFRIFGRDISPVQLLYRHWSGLYGSEREGYLYVNDGVGYAGIPARVGARPEITLITLRK